MDVRKLEPLSLWKNWSVILLCCKEARRATVGLHSGTLCWAPLSGGLQTGVKIAAFYWTVLLNMNFQLHSLQTLAGYCWAWGDLFASFNETHRWIAQIDPFSLYPFGHLHQVYVACRSCHPSLRSHSGSTWRWEQLTFVRTQDEWLFIQSYSNHVTSPILILEHHWGSGDWYTFCRPLQRLAAQQTCHDRRDRPTPSPWALWLTASHIVSLPRSQLQPILSKSSHGYGRLWFLRSCCRMLFGCHTMPHRFVQKWGIRFWNIPTHPSQKKKMKLAIFIGFWGTLFLETHISLKALDFDGFCFPESVGTQPGHSLHRFASGGSRVCTAEGPPSVAKQISQISSVNPQIYIA